MNDLAPVASRLAEALASFQQEQELAEAHLFGALLIGLSAGAAGKGLIDRILADERLLSEPERLQKVLGALNKIPAELRDKAFLQLDAHVEADPTVLLKPLHKLEEQEGIELLQAAQVPVRAWLDGQEAEGGSEEAAAYAESLREAIGRGKPLLALVAIEILLPNRATYSIARDWAAPDAFTDDMHADLRDRVALLGLRDGPAEDRSYWRIQLSGKAERVQSSYGTDVVVHELSRFQAQDHSGQHETFNVIEAVAPYLTNVTDEGWESIQVAINGALQEGSWWTSNEALSSQEWLHDSVGELFEVSGAPVAPLENLLKDDVFRGFASGQWSTPTTLSGLRELGRRLPNEAGDVLSELANGYGVTGDLTRDVDIMRTRASLAVAAKEGGVDVSAEVVDQRTLIEAADQRIASASDLVADWLRLDPPAEAVSELAATDIRLNAKASENLSDWGGRLGENGRDQVLIDLVRLKRDVSDWIRPLSLREVDEELIISEIGKLVRDAPNADRRREVVHSLVALAPQHTPAQRRAADIVITLLATGKRVDFDIALEVVPVLNTNHRSAERLRQAFKRAADDHAHKVPKGSIDALDKAGVKLPKKTLTDSALDLAKKLWGR